jgi:cytochrome c-type biogenesis protein CcsB
MPREEVLLQAAMICYVVALFAYLLRFATRAPQAGSLGSLAAWVGVLAQTTMLVTRGLETHRLPLISMYEYLTAFSWTVALTYLVFERRAGTAEGVQAAGAPALALSVALLGYAATLPVNLKQPEALMPVLKSDWLIFHVGVAVIGYGAAGLASALALLYFLSYLSRRVNPGGKWLVGRLPSEASLDRSIYHAIRFAFPFLTLVNVTGAIWAYNAWGRYWGWDPKETWSLITWMIYTFYLHARLRAGWKPPHRNLVVLVGIAAILVTFLGVNKLGAYTDSLHSYSMPGQ